MTHDDVLEALVEECQSDHVGLWEVVNSVKFDLGVINPQEVQATTIRLVRKLLQERHMLVGHPAPDGRGFVSWELPAAAAIDRIDRQMSSLGREPNIGEVAWFTSPMDALAPKESA